MALDNWKTALNETIDLIIPEAWKINKWLYQNPELPMQEYGAVKNISHYLETKGFRIDYNVAGLDTAFKASYKVGEGGPKVGFLAEYDALPEIGHGCGHNLIAASCVGSAVALSKILQEPAEIVVFGTPDEEYDGGKIIMAEKGIFSDLDMAMQIHPSPDRTFVGGSSVPHQTMVISYKGSPAHTAVNPSAGINALNAVLIAFAGLYSLQQYLKPGTRIPATITHGGGAPNVVPQFAQFRVHITTQEKEYLSEVTKKVENCAKAGALATGAVEDIWKSYPYKKLNSNQVLTELLADKLLENGYQLTVAPEHMAATDVGNVSWECPTVMSYLSMGQEGMVMHSKEFAKATVSDAGEKFLRDAIKAMCAFTWIILHKPEYLEKVKNEFNSKEKTD